MWAPASTWAIASRSTRLKSPAFISSARSLAAGRVDPLADDDERPVVADDDLAGGRAEDGLGHAVESLASAMSLRRGIGVSWAGASAGPPATPPDWISSASRCLSYSASSRSASAVDLGLDVVAAARAALAPLLDVVVVGALAGAARGLVDRDLEARVED